MLMKHINKYLSSRGTLKFKTAFTYHTHTQTHTHTHFPEFPEERTFISQEVYFCQNGILTLLHQDFLMLQSGPQWSDLHQHFGVLGHFKIPCTCTLIQDSLPSQQKLNTSSENKANVTKKRLSQASFFPLQQESFIITSSEYNF